MKTSLIATAIVTAATPWCLAASGGHSSGLARFACDLEFAAPGVGGQGMDFDFEPGLGQVGLDGQDRGRSGGVASPAGMFSPIHTATGSLPDFGSFGNQGSFGESGPRDLMPRRAALLAPLPAPVFAGLAGLAGVVVIRRRSV